MTTTTSKVERYMQRDVIFERSLARGTLSLRRGARWLLDKRDWDATEEAVVSALRRYVPAEAAVELDEGYDLLRKANTGLATGWGLVTVPTVGSTVSRVWETIETTSTKDEVGVLPATSDVTYIVRCGVAEGLEDEFGESLREVVRPVTRMTVEFERGALAMPIALGILQNTFSYRGIPVVEVFSSAGELSIVVPDRYTARADEVLVHLGAEDVRRS